MPCRQLSRPFLRATWASVNKMSWGDSQSWGPGRRRQLCHSLFPNIDGAPQKLPSPPAVLWDPSLSARLVARGASTAGGFCVPQPAS